MDAWMAWATADDSPLPAVIEAAPLLPQVPPIARRRLDQLGRVALQAAFDAAEQRPRLPSIFVSRRGDAPRSFELLKSLAAGDGMSPTAFGLSVHNAIAAQFSMVRVDSSTYSALAAGSNGVENALVEAAGWLGDGTRELLLVAFDTVVPAAFRSYQDEPDPVFAWAWRLAPAGSAGRCLRLTLGGTEPDVSTEDPSQIPASLLPMRQFLRGTRQWSSGYQGQRWAWSFDE